MNTDQLYNDFKTQLLPKVAEGMSITKDYFLDLFGRYVKYLIITDAIWTFVGFIVLLITFFWAVPKVFKIIKDDESFFPLAIGLLIPIFLGGIIFFTNLDELIKDLYIPEIRVYQEIMTDSNGKSR